MIQTDTGFTGHVPQLYETYLVPLLFEPYAIDMVTRLQRRKPQSVLETAAGTGVVTRQLDTQLPANVRIVATDLNQPMLDQAALQKSNHVIEWKAADAQQLPFADESFDAVVCQFGVMFFPDKPKAYAEAFRVLKPGGVFLFNVWGSLHENDFGDAVHTAMETLFPADPPRFLARTPYAYHDAAGIADDLAAGGFTKVPVIETVTCYTTSASPKIPATAFCYGSPLRNDIVSRHEDMLDKAVEAAEAEIARRFGAGKAEGKLQAKVVEVLK